MANTKHLLLMLSALMMKTRQKHPFSSTKSAFHTGEISKYNVSEIPEITASVSFQSSRLFESEGTAAGLVKRLVSTRHTGSHRIHHPLGSSACPALSSSLRHTCGTKMQMCSQGGTIVAGGIQNSD